VPGVHEHAEMVLLPAGVIPRKIKKGDLQAQLIYEQS
jgi:hypothetical protein